MPATRDRSSAQGLPRDFKSRAAAGVGDLCHFRPDPPVKTGKITGGFRTVANWQLTGDLPGPSAGGIREDFDLHEEGMLPGTFAYAGHGLLLPLKVERGPRQPR